MDCAPGGDATRCTAGGPAPSPSDTPPPASDSRFTLDPWNGLLRGRRDVDVPPGDWTINARLEDGGRELRLAAEAIEDMLFLCQYQVA
jgi:hypothetical protein